MKFTLEVNLGSNKITVTEDAGGQEELFQKASFLMNLPDKCGNCGEGSLALHHKEYDGNDYYAVVCKDCKHELKFGVLKAGGLFPKEWEPPYSADGDSEEEDESPKKKSNKGSSVLARAKAAKAKAAKAAKEEDSEEEYENSETEEKETSTKSKRSALLAKFGKKKGA